MNDPVYEASLSFAEREKQNYYAAEGWVKGWVNCGIDLVEDEEDRIARIDALLDEVA